MKKVVFGIHAVSAILKENPQIIEMLYLQKGRNDERMHQLEQLALEHHITIEKCSKFILDKHSQNKVHQGILAFTKNSSQDKTNDLADWVETLTSPKRILVLDSVQDPHNLGACIRTAEASGFKTIILPKDNACDITPTVHKAACGATEYVDIFKVANLAQALDLLKDKGFWVYGLAEEATQSMYQESFAENCVIVLGAEGKGMRRLIQEKCDYLLNIPMQGMISSLNVSVACGVVLFEIVRQFKK